MKTRVLSFILAAVMLVGAFSLASCSKKAFDYSNEDLSKYVTVSESDYKNVPASIPLDFSALDIYAFIASKADLLSEDEISALSKTDKELAKDDIVAIYYRGVTVSEDGKETEFAGGSNLGQEKPTWLYVGSGMFVEEFENALVGKNFASTSVTKVTEGKVAEDDLITIDIAGVYGDSKTYMLYENLAVKLSESTIFSDEIKAEFKDERIGENIFFTLELDADGDKTPDTVTFTAKVHNKIELNAEKISVQFPEDYDNSELAGKTAQFYVAIEDVLTPSAALAEAFSFEAGEDAAESIKRGAEKALINAEVESFKEENEGKDYEDTVKAAIWEAIVAQEFDIEYPESAVKSYIKTAKNNLELEFFNYVRNEEESARQKYDTSADLKSKYKNFTQYAIYLFGDKDWKGALEEKARKEIYGEGDWEAELESEAKESVKRKLIFYTIAKQLDVNSASKSDINEVKKELKASYTEYYMQMYSLYSSLLNWGYTEEQCKQLAESDADAAIASMSDTYLSEIAIKEKILDIIYADYDADTLVSWTSSAFDAEEETEKKGE